MEKAQAAKFFRETEIPNPKEVPGHATVETTQIHTRVLQKPGSGTRGPLDR
jgi:hypothetical protein